MTRGSAGVVICGAGIAGISAAYHLAVRQNVADVVLVDDLPPLSLTSDKSTECYRNWWPGPGDAMVALMNHSIDIMEGLARESGDYFHLNRRGYLYVTASAAGLAELQRSAYEASALGAGPVRLHAGRPADPPYDPSPAEGFEGQPDGADLITDQVLIRRHFPYLSEDTLAVLHARRCGWLSAQQLGAYLLTQAREHGVRLVKARLTGIVVDDAGVEGVRLSAEPWTLATRHLVLAAGPFLKQAGAMLGLHLPVHCELHTKVSFSDRLQAVPRQAPLLIWTDPQTLAWSGEERAALAESAEGRLLLGEMPSGVHARPEGGADSRIALGLWPYHTPPVEPVVPPRVDPLYYEAVLRGLSTMLPACRPYLERAPRPEVDGGYYCRTPENRPLIGPLPVRGTFVAAAFSGFGIMAACGAGELLAAHVTGGPLPPYAPAFLLDRYDDPSYQAMFRTWEGTGQL